MTQAGPNTDPGVLKIVTVYDGFVNYIEQILDAIPQRYARLHAAFLDVMWRVPEQLYIAAMSDQVSHLHKADAMLATLRWFMRRMVRRKPNLPKKESPPLTPAQQGHAEALLGGVGGMINGWLVNKAIEREAARKEAARKKAIAARRTSAQRA